MKSPIEFPEIAHTPHYYECKKEVKLLKYFEDMKRLVEKMLCRNVKERVRSYRKIKEILTFKWSSVESLTYSFVPFKSFSYLPDHYFNLEDENKYLINRKLESNISEAIGVPFNLSHFTHKYNDKHKKRKIKKILNIIDDFSFFIALFSHFPYCSFLYNFEVNTGFYYFNCKRNE